LFQKELSCRTFRSPRKPRSAARSKSGIFGFESINNANEPARTGGFFVGKANRQDAENAKKIQGKANENVREQAEEAG
jgi:hypothetical protein